IPFVALTGLRWWLATAVIVRSDPRYIANSLQARLTYVWQAVPDLHEYLLVTVVTYAEILGIVLIPLLAACWTRAHLKGALRPLAVLSILIALNLVFFGGGFAWPLNYGQMWSIHELGATQRLTRGYTEPGVNIWLLRVLGAVAAAMVAGAVGIVAQSRLGRT